VIHYVSTFREADNLYNLSDSSTFDGSKKSCCRHTDTRSLTSNQPYHVYKTFETRTPSHVRSTNCRLYWFIRSESTFIFTGWEFFSSLQCPERLSRPPGLLSNGYHGLFPSIQWRGKKGVELYLHSLNTPPCRGAYL